MFERRHLEHLATFARDKMSRAQQVQMCNALAAVTPRFNAVKFLLACGWSQPEITGHFTCDNM